MNYEHKFNQLTLGNVCGVQIPFCSKYCWISQTNIVGLFVLSLRISLRILAVKRGRVDFLDGSEFFNGWDDSIVDGGFNEKFIGGIIL